MIDEATAGEAEARAAMAPPPAPPVVPETGTLGTAATPPQLSPTNALHMDAPTFTNTMLSVFQDPDTLTRIGELAVKYQQPQWLDYLKQGYLAQKENAGTAAMRLIAGDTQGALAAFNAGGQHKATAITPAADAPGQYDVALTGPDGQPYVRRVDPKKEMLALLTPPQYIAAVDKEAALQTRAKQLEAQQRQFEEKQKLAADIAAGKKETADQLNTLRDQRWADRSQNERDLTALRSQGLDLQGKLNEARIGAATAQAELARARAGTVGDTKRNWSSINNAIDREARDTDFVKRPNKIDPTKTEVDGTRLSMVRSLAQNLARQNPDFADAPGEAVYTAVQKLNEIDQMVSQKVGEEEKQVKAGEPGLLERGSVKDYYAAQGVKNLDEWRAKRVDKLRREAMAGLGLGNKPAGPDLASPAPPPAPSAGLVSPAAAAPAPAPVSSPIPPVSPPAAPVAPPAPAAGTPAAARAGAAQEQLVQGTDGRVYLSVGGKVMPLPDGRSIVSTDGKRFTTKDGKLVPLGAR